MELVIRDLSKTYPNGTRALTDVSLDVPKGMFGLLGRNGAGKSTLMRIIATLQEPDEGAIHLGDLDVVAKKMRADSVGNETEVPVDDLVEIGVFAPGEGDGPGDPLYLRRHRIRTGEQTVRITVLGKPARAGIDPYRKLIDRQGSDNVVEVDRAEVVLRRVGAPASHGRQRPRHVVRRRPDRRVEEEAVADQAAGVVAGRREDAAAGEERAGVAVPVDAGGRRPQRRGAGGRPGYRGSPGCPDPLWTCRHGMHHGGQDGIDRAANGRTNTTIRLRDVSIPVSDAPLTTDP